MYDVQRMRRNAMSLHRGASVAMLSFAKTGTTSDELVSDCVAFIRECCERLQGATHSQCRAILGEIRELGEIIAYVKAN